MNLQQILQEFIDTITLVKSLISGAHQTKPDGTNLWKKPERHVIVEAAFLRLFKGWEAFLENTFHAYLLGTNSLSGNVINRFVNPQNINHAREIAVGTRQFVDWSTPEFVRILAKNYFGASNPFDTVINSIHSDLRDMKTIRNAAAHLSSTTSGPLDSLATRRLQKAVLGMNVYDFVLASDPQATNKTIIETYMDILQTATHQIAHA